MRNLKPYTRSPKYHGNHWIKAQLPNKVRDWSHGKLKSVTNDGDGYDAVIHTLQKLNHKKAWRWPKRRHYFFTDLHADAQAFAESLVASGGVEKTGPKPTDFKLTEQGRRANFIIGGDCFDKGPSTLKLLQTIHHLIKQGARVRILAGNHDVRVLLGMIAVDLKKDRHNEHFFIRTGQKIIPLLKEIRDEYVTEKDFKQTPSNKECRKRLYPSNDWFEDFPAIAKGYIRPAQVRRELARIQKKCEKFEHICDKHDMTLRDVYVAVEKWKALFLDPKAEFYWFFKRMRLGLKTGSLLFVHAGLDNVVSRQLYEGGIKDLNRSFRHALKHRPFTFYYGPLCNTIRTKYRDVDHPLSSHGTRYLRRAGISAVIHGHRNLHNGQRLALRKSLLNFECDTSVDSHTRKKEGLRGRGAGVTIIEPKGHILAISSDYPYAKVFEPKMTLRQLKKIRKKLRRLV